MIPVILSGGSGTRLWPLSRARFPKQFLPLIGQQTMLQQTLARLEGLEDVARPMVVCNEEHRFIVAEQLRQMDGTEGDIILEPVGRNTAPAIAVAALRALADDEEAILLVMAADHAIENVGVFHHAIQSGLDAARDGALVTFGIVPTHAETGYGYIRAVSAAGHTQTAPVAMSIEAFVEKPDLHTAKDYVASGHYFWNSGMFMFKAAAYLAELESFAPEIVRCCRQALAGAKADLDFLRLGKEAFSASPDVSIDYAVMEHTRRAMVVPMNAGWSDVGSWSAVWQVSEKDEDGNACKGDVLLQDASDNYVHGSHRLVSLLGVQDLVVIDTHDAVMVAHKNSVQDVKKLVDRLKQTNRSEATLHREVFRPWGSYDSIDNGTRHQVKRITVKPGARLSLQMHHHRAEHWIVVSGTARIRNGDQELLLTENQSTYIPLGTIHSLENPGKIPLELIEVQSGPYLGEDDIVRFEDQYGRCGEG